MSDQQLGSAILYLKADRSQYDPALDDAHAKAQDFDTQAATTSKHVESNWKEMATGVAEALTAAFETTSRLIEKWAEADRSQTQLNFAVQSSSMLYYGAADTLTAFADHMKELTGVDDDLIKSQLGIEASFGLTEKQMENVMTAALNLSSTGMVSLDQAVRGLAGSFDGSIGLLGRYVPSLKDLTKEQLAAGDAVDLVNAKFKDMAATLGGTLSGQLNNLHNAFEDLLKQSGRVLALDFGWLVKPFASLLNGISGSVKATMDLRDAQTAYQKGNATLDQQILVLNAHYDEMNAKYKDAIANIILARNQSDAIQKQRQAEANAILADLHATADLIQKIKDQQDAEKKRADQAAANAKAAAARAAARKKALEEALAQGKALMEFSDQEERKKVEDEQKVQQALKETNALVAEGQKNSADALKAYEADVAARWAAIQKQHDDLTKARSDELQAQQKADELEAASAKKAAEETARTWERAWRSIDSDIKSVMGSLGAIADQYFANQNNALDEWYQNQIAALGDMTNATQEQTDAKAKIDKEYADKQKALKQEQWTDQKLLDLSNAVMNTAAAIAAALPNVALSVIAGALGAVQIGLIAAEPMPAFASGADFVVPQGYPGDSYPMRVQSGEHVSVTPAASAGAAGSSSQDDGTINIDSYVLARWVTQAIRDRRILVDRGALV